MSATRARTFATGSSTAPTASRIRAWIESISQPKSSRKSASFESK